jgi:hypothetical protein
MADPEPLGPFLVSPFDGGGGGGCRPYLENYIVDASILDSNSRVCAGFGSRDLFFRSLVCLLTVMVGGCDS